MITVSQHRKLMESITGPEFAGKQELPEEVTNADLLKAIQQLIDVQRVSAAAALYALTPVPDPESLQPTAPKPMGQGIRRKPLL